MIKESPVLFGHAIEKLLRSDDERMFLVQISLDKNHEYDEYYHSHPDVMHGLFKLVSLLANGLNNKNFVIGVDNRVSGVHKVNFSPIDKHCRMFYVHIEGIRRNTRYTLANAGVFHSNGERVLTLEGVRIVRNNVPFVPQLPPIMSQSILKALAKDVGIIAFDYYCPNHCIRASDLEVFHSSKGQYTIGRGQENITFCSDDEDAVSMAMSVLIRLMERCGLNYNEIGRLEVGTESQVDRAKSIKSFLMELFGEHGCYDVVGVDTYNACYGGTNALFNTLNWVQSDSWNGKYAIVVCSDIAVHPDRAHLSGIGASAIAMLVGPHAPFIVDPKRATFIKHTWDFYRPIGWHNNDAIIDLDIATEQYEEALAACQENFSSQVGTADILSLYNYFAFHCNAPYHAKRSFRLICNTIYGEELSKKLHNDLYERHVQAGTSISAQNATTHTCPLYACLLSLVLSVQKEDLIGKRILCFSYGSGCAASMYGIRVQGLPLHPDDLLLRLQSRDPITVEKALSLIDAFENTYGRFGFEPTYKSHRQDGAYYLEYVDKNGVRRYKRHEKINSVSIEKEKDSIITRFKLMQETIDDNMVRGIIDNLEPGRIHVFTSACENFCVGASAGGDIDLEKFLDGTQGFAEFHTSLLEVCDLPIVCACNGSTRGGGMIFPSISDIMLVTKDASFGFPEVRRGVLPGIVSVSSRRRLSDRQCKRWMMTGDSFDSLEGLSIGFVDHVIHNKSIKSFVNDTLKILLDTPIEILRAKKQIIRVNGDLNMTVVEAGSLSLSVNSGYKYNNEWMVHWKANGVATLEFKSGELNWDSVVMLLAQICDLSHQNDLRVLIFSVPSSSNENIGSKNLIEHIINKHVELPLESFDKTVASFYQLAWVSRCALSSIKIPILAVLDGPMHGFEAALALAADWRVSTHDASFYLTGFSTNSLFEICKAVRALISAGMNELPPILDVVEMQRLNLVSFVYEKNTEALHMAERLAITISNSPSTGVQNTMRLLRRELPSKTQLAKICVSFVKTHHENILSQNITEETYNIHLLVEKYFIRMDVTGGIISAAELLTSLQVASQQTKSLSVCICLDQIIVNLNETEDVLKLCSWIFCKNIDCHVPVVIVCRSQKVPLLLVTLADQMEITANTTFDLSVSYMLMLACIAIRYGVSGCGKIQNIPHHDLTAQDVIDSFYIANGPVESLLEGIALVREKFEEDTIIKAWSAPKEFSISDYISCSEETDLILQNSADKLPVILDNVACLHFSIVDELIHQLDHVNQYIDLNCVILYVIPEERLKEPPSNDFMTILSNLHKKIIVLQTLRGLSVPSYSIIDCSITGFGSVVAMVSDYRIGTQTSKFNLGDSDVSSLVFSIFDLLPNIIGPTQAESIRFLRPILSTDEALQLGILTDICKDIDSFTGSVLHKLHKAHCLDLILKSTIMQLTLQEIYRRYFSSSMKEILNSECVSPTGAINLKVENNNDVIRLRVGDLTEATAMGIIKALQPESSMHVFYLEENTNLIECKLRLTYYRQLEEFLKQCKLPIITLFPSSDHKGRSALMLAADIVISNHVEVSDITSSTKMNHRVKPSMNYNAVIFVNSKDIDSILNKLLARFRKIGSHLLRGCKANLPTTTVAEALQTMKYILLVDKSLSHQDFGLVNLNILYSKIAIIEMDDPEYYNAMSAELMSTLLTRVLEVKTLAEKGTIRAVILQGKGAHFCTGGYVQSSGRYLGKGENRSNENAETSLNVVTSIRKLPVPTLAIVHGKLIGGGVALALATDWRICPNKTTFNFGNLPRGMSPIMNLSLALSLIAGYGVASQLYLDDTVVGALEAVDVGLINQVVDNNDDAKRVVIQTISESGLISEIFFHGPVSRLCALSNSHAVLELHLIINSLKNSTLALTYESRSTNEHRITKPQKIENRASKTILTGKIWTKEAVKMKIDNSVRNIIGFDTNDNIDHSLNLMDVGLDSLSVVELSNDLQSQLEMDISPTLIFSEPTINDLSTFLCNQLLSDHKHIRRNVKNANSLLLKKCWTKEAVTIEVENAVKKVIGSKDDDHIDHSSNLMDIGLDSLSVVELSNDLQSCLGIEVSSTLVFSEPTIKDLSNFLYDRLSMDTEQIKNESDTGSCARRLSLSNDHIVGPAQLVLPNRGSLENLSVSPFKGFSEKLSNYAVEVNIFAVGLNFKDVLNVLVPDEVYVGYEVLPLPGLEFSGTVTDIPVSHSTNHFPYNIGDKVYGAGYDLLRSMVRISITSIAKMPSSICFEEAAHLPMVFLTVVYAFSEQIKLKAGDRVLIHSGAGGVGLAAIQHVNNAGAEIFVTASPSKHDYLRAMGVNNMSTSRDEGKYFTEMKQITGDKGVDVILNSLTSGNFIQKSVSLIKTGGYFIELGKRNTWSHDKMRMNRPDIKYFTHTFNELLPEKPERLSPMLCHLAKRIDAGCVKSLPYKTFHFKTGLIDAFRYLQNGNTIGKIVIRVHEQSTLGVSAITGSLGGLLEMGAKHINLVSQKRKAKDYGHSETKLPVKMWTKESVTKEVDNAVKNVIGCNNNDHVNHFSNLMDIGLDSLSVVELSNDLQSRLEIDVSSTLIFSQPTIKDLSDFLFAHLSLDTEKNCKDKVVQSEVDTHSNNNEWAVIGISCTFPGGVTDWESYWRFIFKGNETSSGIPFDRWDSAAISSQSDLNETQKMQVSCGSFVNEMESFDPSFFDISMAEASSMSPQQHILLQCAYLAFEDAGYTKEKMKGLKCGVFVGMATTEKLSFGFVKNKLSVYDATGSTASIATGRISYIFDLQGPNAAFDTACSSSLVALNMAILSLRSGECKLALVAGVNELFDHRPFLLLARAGMLSPTGRCHTWDTSADGFLRGEGCGAILLKALDASSYFKSYATVIGASIQSDGKSANITAPNGSAQKRLIQKALIASSIEPDEVDYIEAHGTGTSLGDPIEVEALAGVFVSKRNNLQPLMIGSVKANMGHLEFAAGVSGLIKAILVLQHEVVPPNVCLKKMNPHIEKIIDSHDFVVKFPIELDKIRMNSKKNDDKLLVAGVSSFGYSGTIAHTILRQAPKDLRRNIASEYQEKRRPKMLTGKLNFFLLAKVPST